MNNPPLQTSFCWVHERSTSTLQPFGDGDGDGHTQRSGRTKDELQRGSQHRVVQKNANHPHRNRRNMAVLVLRFACNVWF